MNSQVWGGTPLSFKEQIEKLTSELQEKERTFYLYRRSERDGFAMFYREGKKEELMRHAASQHEKNMTEVPTIVWALVPIGGWNSTPVYFTTRLPPKPQVVVEEISL